MTQTLRFITTWVLFATAFLGLAGWLHYNGFLSESTVRIWSKVILQLDGPPGFQSSESLYPPLPLFVSMILHKIIGASGIPIPTLSGVLAASLVAACIFLRMTEHGKYRHTTAFLVLALMLGNPVSLYAITGTSEVSFLFLGLWTTTNGLFRLRRTGAAPDMMQIGIGLMIVGLSSSYGLLICLSALPFLAIAAPPRLIVASSSGTILAIVFPVFCAVGSLFLLSAVFDTPLIAKDLEFGASETFRVTAVLFLVSGGLAHLTTLAIWRGGQSAVPMICMIGTVGSAMLLDLSIGYFNDVFLTASPLILLGCAGLCAWPQRKMRGLIVVFATTFAWAGGFYQISQHDNLVVVQWSDAVYGKQTDIRDVELVARFLSEREGVMLDGEQNPELIIALDGIDRLVLNGAPEFELVAEGGRPKENYIVLRNVPTAPVIKDRLMRRFATVKDSPPGGYTIILEQGEWIVLERI